MSLGILANPIAINKTLNTVAAGVRTDIDFISMLGLARYAKIITQGNLERFVFDDTQDGLLVSGNANAAYILTPKAGMEEYSEIRERFKNVFAKTPNTTYHANALYYYRQLQNSRAPEKLPHVAFRYYSGNFI